MTSYNWTMLGCPQSSLRKLASRLFGPVLEARGLGALASDQLKRVFVGVSLVGGGDTADHAIRTATHFDEATYPKLVMDGGVVCQFGQSWTSFDREVLLSSSSLVPLCLHP